MGFYGMTNDNIKEINAANKIKKDIERQKALEEETKIADSKQAIVGVSLRRNFGDPLFFIDGRSSNLWVYPDKVILDRSKGGAFNLFNHTIKIIPMKNILTIQFKNAGAFVGLIEFGVAGADSNRKDIADVDNENMFMFGSEKSTVSAVDAYFYIAKRISE